MLQKTIWLACAFAVASMAAPDAPVIDNERVSVHDITLNPGTPGTMERHQTDYVIMFLVGGQIRTTSADGQTSVAMRNPGDAVFGKKGTEDKVEVASGGPARLIVIDLKDHPVPPLVNKSGLPPAFPRPGSKKILENDRVVVWNYTWKPGVATPMHFHDKDVVVVYRYEGSLKSTAPDGDVVVNNYKFGTIKFNKSDRSHSEELVKGQESAMMMELK